MEKVKDPAMMLGIANSVGLVGGMVYFYREIQAIRADQAKLSQAVNKLVKSVGDLEKNEQNRLETIKSVSSQVKEIDKVLDCMPTNEELEEMESNLSAVVHALEQSDLKLDIPHSTPRKPDKRSRRDDDRRVKHGRSRTTPRRTTYSNANDSDSDSDLVATIRSASRT